LLLAGLNLLTGLDVFVLGQAINILSFGAIIYLSGLLFECSLPKSVTFHYVGTLIVATSLPLLEVSANIASDPQFMIAALLFLLAAQSYASTRERSYWLAMAGLAIAACFLRYAGLTLIISGALIVLWVHRRELLKALSESAAFGIVAGAPIAAFAILHNLPANGTLLGSHRPSIALTNFLLLFEKMAGWFAPGSWLTGALPFVLFLSAAVALHFLAKPKQQAAWHAKLVDQNFLPSMVFFFVYGAVLVFAISTSEHQVPGSQRIHAVLLPAFLLLAAMTISELQPKLPKKLAGIPFQTILLAGFALWLLLPLFRVQAYVRASLQEGDVSFYNLYNTRTLRESDIVHQLSTMVFGADEKVYSNNEGAAWFYLRRRIYRLPRYNAEAGETLENALVNFNGWPNADEQATLIWFERELDYKDLVPTPDEMQGYIRLTPIFTGRYGDIYLMDIE
jgi:hypothetical protein